jgi:hypothetical protein
MFPCRSREQATSFSPAIFLGSFYLPWLTFSTLPAESQPGLHGWWQKKDFGDIADEVKQWVTPHGTLLLQATAR